MKNFMDKSIIRCIANVTKVKGEGESGRDEKRREDESED
jgi:hypothetical protein